MGIDVLVPVLGRPQNVKPLLDNFHEHAPEGCEIVFLVSPADTPIYKECLDGQRWRIMDFDPGPGDYARKMNAGYMETDEDWVFLGADDIRFTAGWADHLTDQADVIATNDQANAQVQKGLFGTHCFVRRSYIDERGASADGPGVLLHEGYDHNFVDRELSGVAKQRGRFRYVADAVVPHQHPLWRTARWDPTYRKAMRNFQADRKLFLERAHLWGYFGLSAQEKNLARRHRRDIVRGR